MKGAHRILIDDAEKTGADHSSFGSCGIKRLKKGEEKNEDPDTNKDKGG